MAAVRSTVAQGLLRTLENEVEFLRTIVKQQREDVEFYRGKVERLELAIMSNPPAQQEYVQTEVVVKPSIKDVRPQVAPQIPFSDLKRKWAAMSAEEQEKAMQEGWEIDKPKEEANAG